MATSNIKKPLITTKSFSNSVTSTNNYAVGTIDVSLSGYKPIGVVEITPAGDTINYWITYYKMLNDTTLQYTLRRSSGSVGTVTSTFTVLYEAV